MRTFLSLPRSLLIPDMSQFITQKVAQAIDEDLMSAAGGFSVDQLMELGRCGEVWLDVGAGLHHLKL
jgi:NAD(P)H-hydrate epimerase